MKSTKKRLAGPLFRAVYGRGVAVFGATSERSLRISLLVRQHSNGDHDQQPSGYHSMGETAGTDSRLRAVFLSRINPRRACCLCWRAFAKSPALSTCP